MKKNCSYKKGNDDKSKTKKIYIQSSNYCVCCGREIPEGSMICYMCSFKIYQ
ncbi:MAG: hypothetical protein LUG12_12795 [Erysipelotrichaceae bacterium]|nr:hypothetical protein [Erysipelotrichaceae bacterium]